MAESTTAGREPSGKSSEKRRFYRAEVDIPATLFLQSSDDLRRSCSIFNLSGSGCAIRLLSLESISEDATHHISFELPNRSTPLRFDCTLVHVSESEKEIAQDLRFKFVNPRGGDQDAIISYIQNRKRFEQSAYRVTIPVTVEAQTGLRQFVPYKGETWEVGKDYVNCYMTTFGLTVTSEVVATFRAPRFRDEIFFQGTVTKLDRLVRGGFNVRILFEKAGDGMLEFVRRYYGDKAKAVSTLS